MEKLFYFILVVSFLINGCKNNVEKGAKGQIKNQVTNSEGLLETGSEAQKEYDKALELFELQIKCVVNDDRETQMGIYAENLRYEFPFANDRPKLIKGRDAFKKAMEPIWEKRRKSNIKILVDKYEFYATDEVGLFVAVFVLKAVIDKKNEPILWPCVQLLRIRDGHIVEVREYFEP